MATYEVTLEQFGPALARVLGSAYRALAVALRAQVAVELYLELEVLSPVGDPAKDKHPGKYRASHIASIGSPQPEVLPDLPTYPLRGAPYIETVLAEAPPGASVWIANAAATAKYAEKGVYGGLLEGGRRQYSRRASQKTQWIGSTQASDGIYGPAVRNIRARAPEIEAAAVAQVRESMVVSL